MDKIKLTAPNFSNFGTVYHLYKKDIDGKLKRPTERIGVYHKITRNGKTYLMNYEESHNAFSNGITLAQAKKYSDRFKLYSKKFLFLK